MVLMGYYNPIYIYGVESSCDAKAAGVDGLIVVDLPPEEDNELCLPALEAGLNFIRLATPTTDDKRLPAVLANTSGFVYYVSITGITGAAAPISGGVAKRWRASSATPVCRSRRLRHPEPEAAPPSRRMPMARWSAPRWSMPAPQPRSEGRATAKTVSAVADLVGGAGAGRAGRQTGRGISHNCNEDRRLTAACRARALAAIYPVVGMQIGLIAIRSET